MELSRFEELVEEAVNSLPPELAGMLQNIDVVVQDYPSSEQLGDLGDEEGHTLLGLYEGVPLTRRGQFYGLVPPDKITIFKKPIESKCFHNEDRIAREIKRVVRHEMAHHFGISDARIDELENGRD